MNKPADAAAAHVTNFIRHVIDANLASGKYASRTWSGRPGLAATHAGAPSDPARIRTRFPPEPNGYLHFGHAKSICLNFGLARDYGGVCHMRFDDTNPEKEEQEYVDSILDALRWLGFGWIASGAEHLYHASDYFDSMYLAAEYLVTSGHAYVDEQSVEEMRATRGTLTEHGRSSPWRDRPAVESLARLREMRAGKHADGSMVLRARIDMASPNINLRDPAIYRIKKATHHRTGDKWCIYPMYTYAHPIVLLPGVRGAAPVLRLAARAPGRRRAARAAAAAAARVRAAQPELCGAVQTQADPAGRRRARRGLGRSAPADARRGAPARLHARGLSPVRRAHRRVQIRLLDRLRRARGMHARAPEPGRAAAHRRARSAEAGDRQLSRGRRRGMPCAQPPAEAGAREARGAVLARAVDRARGFHGDPGQGLFPAIPPRRNTRRGPPSRKQGAAALRLRDRMHRLRQGRFGQRHRRALQLLRRQQIGHARFGCLQGQRQRPLGLGQARLPVRGAALRPLVPRAASGRRGARYPARPEPGGEESHQRAARARAEAGPARGALPVRAARVLRGGHEGLQSRRAGVQPRGDVEGCLAKVTGYASRLESRPRCCRVAMLRGRKTVRADRRLRTDEKHIRAQSAILYENHPKPPWFLLITVFLVRMFFIRTKNTVGARSAQVFPIHLQQTNAARYRSPSVIAPRLAVETSFMYLASTPRV